MIIKLQDIVLSQGKFPQLLAVALPVKTACWISKLYNGKVQSELKNYEDNRIKLVREYGEQGEDGNYQVKDPSKLEEFAAKLQELLDLEVDMGTFEPISIEELGDVKLSADAVIPWLFK